MTEENNNMRKDRQVTFDIKIEGRARAYVPAHVSDNEVMEYINTYAPTYAGNKMWEVEISDIKDLVFEEF